jgi:hypothetical protein
MFGSCNNPYLFPGIAEIASAVVGDIGGDSWGRSDPWLNSFLPCKLCTIGYQHCYELALRMYQEPEQGRTVFDTSIQQSGLQREPFYLRSASEQCLAVADSPTKASRDSIDMLAGTLLVGVGA